MYEERVDTADANTNVTRNDTKDGSPVEVADTVIRTVSYRDLSAEEKKNVLADLLVKGAISYALDQHSQVSDCQGKAFQRVPF